MGRPPILTFFFFNDTATTEIYTLSLHDALPIWRHPLEYASAGKITHCAATTLRSASSSHERSEEHTSELQSRSDLVCRLLLEKKKTIQMYTSPTPMRQQTMSLPLLLSLA